MSREPARSFQDLLVWQRAHRLALGVYHFTAGFPKEEAFGLRAQMRRAAVAVPANIAEGFKKRGRPDKLRYLNIAEGTLEEVRYYLLLARDLSYGEQPGVARQAEEVARLLSAYGKSISSGVK